MSRVKKNTQEHQDVVDKLTLAALQLKNSNLKVGLRNFGPDTWFFTADGFQTCIHRSSTMVIDEKTFKKNIEPISAYTKGFIVRDDSVLSADETAAKPTPRPHNAILDEEIDQLIKDEDKAFDYISKVTSDLTLKRIMAKCKGNKRKNNIMQACEDQMFLVQNELPSDFYSLARKEIIMLIKDRSYPIHFDSEDEVDEIRDRLVNYLQEG